MDGNTVKNKPNNMSDLPKFILSYDREKKQEYIIHTQPPAFIAKVIPDYGQLKDITELIKDYQFGARTNRINGTYYIIPVIRFFEDAEDPERLPKLMSRMGDWYYSVAKERSANEHH